MSTILVKEFQQHVKDIGLEFVGSRKSRDAMIPSDNPDEVWVAEVSLTYKRETVKIYWEVGGNVEHIEIPASDFLNMTPNDVIAVNANVLRVREEYKWSQARWNDFKASIRADMRKLSK